VLIRTTKRRPPRPFVAPPDSNAATSFRAICTGSSALGNAAANVRSTAFAQSVSNRWKTFTAR
jgi:hypothetical protein